jgi:hypothetical protein
MMQRLVTYGSLFALLLAASEARPCGGAFGANVTLDPVQQIIVSYRDGVETYVFNPHFCGQSNTFGLILPVPATLTQNPALGQTQTYKDLATVAAPTYVDQTQCASRGTTGGSASASMGGSSGISNGTTVIQRGQVGIFDWALLQATSTTAFTDWLTANGFPYQSSAQSAFSSYVSSGWYFVAFKVSAGDTGAGGAGSVATTTGTSNATICGDFGPIALAFPSATQPVVPARIAAVSSNQLTWTLFTLASQELMIRDFSSTLMYSGPIGDSEMSTYPSLAPVARSGDRLTELQVSLTAATTTDIVLVPHPNPSDYRRVETRIVYVSCTGGAPNTGGTSATSHAGGGTSGAGGIWTGGVSTIGIATGGSTATANTGGSSNAQTIVAVAGATATSGGNAQGGATATSGGNAQGGAPPSSSTVSLPTGGKLASTLATPANKRDDSGCSIQAPRSNGKSAIPAIILALAALGAGRRKRK